MLRGPGADTDGDLYSMLVTNYGLARVKFGCANHTSYDTMQYRYNGSLFPGIRFYSRQYPDDCSAQFSTTAQRICVERHLQYPRTIGDTDPTLAAHPTVIQCEGPHNPTGYAWGLITGRVVWQASEPTW